jgi:hypothetical protein
LKLALKHQKSINQSNLTVFLLIGPRNSWVFYLNYAVHIYAN